MGSFIGYLIKTAAHKTLNGLDRVVRVSNSLRFAGSPTLRSPFFKKATTEGVVRRPSSFAITTGSLPSITDTQELVVPKSIPIIFAIVILYFYIYYFILFHSPVPFGSSRQVFNIFLY
jgi:hypothetical protein